MSSPFRHENGVLAAGGVSLSDLAAAHGTPLYVYHRPTIAERVERVKRAFAGHPTRLCYSVKANSNLRLLEWLATQGVGFDVVSGGEIDRTVAVGIDPAEVVFAGVGKTAREIERAVELGLWMINVESVGEIEIVAGAARRRGGAPVAISLRINPDVDARTHRHITTGRGADKFGIAVDDVAPLVADLVDRPEVVLEGLHMHLGSQIDDPAPYAAGLEVVLDCGERARSHGHPVRWINAGGGFAIAYDDAEVPEPERYAEALIPGVESFGAGLVLELGRYLVGPAGCLVTRILYRKRREPGLVIVDAGMSDLLRPALYEAHHRVVPVAESDGRAEIVTDVAGPICESTDYLARGRRLPPLDAGALVAVLDVGAYGMAMASHYNTHPRAAEVWILESGAVETIRRRETSDDLLAVEREAL